MFKKKKTSINSLNKMLDTNEEKTSELENRAKKLPQNVAQWFIHSMTNICHAMSLALTISHRAK